MTEPPRVLLLSERRLETPKWQAAHYEFEDVIAEIDSVRLVAPARAPLGLVTDLRRRVTRRVGRPELVGEPLAEAVDVDGFYDLFFCIMHFPTDLAHLHRLRGWRERCNKAVCFLVELWEHEIPRSTPYLELLKRFGFDHVFILHARHRDVVRRLSGAPCDYMGVGVDALRFSPYPSPPPRVVDFYQFGRRSPYTHQAALRLARTEGAFYLYDTVFNVPLPDPRAHREAIASIVKRARYFFAYTAADDHERAAGEDVVSARYIEGIAGGAIVLGSAPRVPEFTELFPWADATIAIPYEAHDLKEIVSELERSPERLAAARINNVVGTLRRHDWVYRWQQVLDAVGLPATPAMAARKARLAELADVAGTPSMLERVS